MALQDAKRHAIAQIVADQIPLELLADVVSEDRIIPNFDELVKLGLGDYSVALSIVERYDTAGAIESLLGRLRARMSGNDFFAAALVDLAYDDESATNLETAIAKRARMLRGAALRQFLEKHEPKICVIAAVADLGDGKVKFLRGTGFLAAEDLVITARHVLRYHVENGKPRNPLPGPLYAFFDHLEGAPISDPRDPTIAARRVEFHPTDWLKAFSDLVVGDGRTPEPLTPPQVEEFACKLDMVLIRLAEPIGAYSRRRGGGVRRGWVTLPTEEIPARLAVDDRILIPQHPRGEAQQIDFGRYKATDGSSTRIRYDTETDRGTSGAPCFNQHFELVGMHNAAFKPPGATEPLNQAIRFDHILRMVKECISAAQSRLPARLWSVAESFATPEVIIGRSKFLSWLETAAEVNLASKEQRVYVAQATRSRCGKSFSWQILKAALRDRSDPRFVMGTKLQSLPNTALDLVQIIVDQLKIPASELATMPERPDASIPSESPDGDKVSLWFSRDLPEWLDGVLRKYRTLQVDLRDEAKAEIERFKKAGLLPNRDDVEMASLEEPKFQVRQRWERIWIALDEVSENALETEVKEVLGGLIGTRGDEGAFYDELRRIRWLFLGEKPTFLGDACVEVLDQMQVTDDDIASSIRSFAMSIDSDPSPEFLTTALSFVLVRRTTPDASPLYDDPNTRLPVLQKIVAEVQNYFERSLKRARQ